MMPQRDNPPKMKPNQSGGQQNPNPKRGGTRYRMQAAQIAEAEAAKAAAAQQTGEDVQDGEDQDPNAEDNVRGLWKSRVLASYRGKNPKDSHTLLAKISEGKATLEVSEKFKTANIQEAMIGIVDKMFDALQNCAYEFNKLASGSELELNWIRPFLAKETPTNALGAPQNNDGPFVFSGRMSTRRWTMVVKGNNDEVLVFILPTDKLIGFALSHRQFKPYFAMTPQPRELDVPWFVDNHQLRSEDFINISKILFDALIRFARAEADQNEIFDLSMIGIKVPKAPDVVVSDEEIDRKAIYQEQFFSDMRAIADSNANIQRMPPAGFDFNKPTTPGMSPPQGFQPSQQPQHHHAQTQPQHHQQHPQAQPHQQQQAQPHQGMPHGAPQGVPQPPAYELPPQMPYSQAPQSQPDSWGAGAASGGWRPMGNPSEQPPAQKPDWRQFMGQPGAPGQQSLPQSQSMPQPQQVPQQSQQAPPMPQQTYPAPQPAPHQAPYMVPNQHPHHSQPVHPTPPQVQGGQMQNQNPYNQHNSQQAQASQQGHYAQQAPQQYNQPPAAPVNQPQAKPQANLGDVLATLVECLDVELEAVVKAGSDAFAAKDLSRAEAALKFSERLTDFRSVAKELLTYYK